ncbi:anthrax toxin-like adenylyl cyclase domain-containing protein [Pantoea sp. App145]|uniref:anthrax toxin-like adenylyl cyclase domain-containing protein n=1 Tax=Pantoea sp. App145 TaxID=3071567 RepID=UPI003A7FC926
MPINIPKSHSPLPAQSTQSSSSAELLAKNQVEKLAEVIDLCKKDNIGIVPNHLVKLQRLSYEKNTIIGIRPVDMMATDLIASGYPTKGFHIKGKSADWGPQTSFICVKQELSKLADRPDKQEGFNKEVQDCMSKGYANKVVLEITKARLDSLVENNYIKNIKYGVNRQPLELEASTPKGAMHKFELVPGTDKGSWQVIYNGEPVEVLAPAGSGQKPLTADYDLFMIAPAFEDYGVEDKLSVHDVSHHIFKERMDSYTTPHEKLPGNLKSSYLSEVEFYAKVDKSVGNVSVRIRNMISSINECLVGNGEPVVHHSTDTCNPWTDIEANFPAVFTLPKSFGDFSEICVVRNVEELKSFAQEAKDEGYYVPLNPVWDKEITDIRSSRFMDAKNFAIRHWTHR